MNITQKTMDNKLILTLSGRFEFNARKTFQSAMAEAEAGDHSQIFLNLAQVPFIDSAALGLLANAHDKFKSANRQLILMAPQDYVLRILELANFQKKMPIVSTEREIEINPVSV